MKVWILNACIFSIIGIIFLNGSLAYAGTFLAAGSCATEMSGKLDLEPSIQTVFTPSLSPSNLGSVKLIDPLPGFFAQGNVSRINGRNFLSVSIFTKSAFGSRRPQILRGKTSLSLILSEFEKRDVRIDAIRSDWSDRLRDYGKLPSDNYVQFLETYTTVLSTKVGLVKSRTGVLEFKEYTEQDVIQAASAAAQSTWSGKQMKEIDFGGIETILIKNSIGELGLDGLYDGSIEISVVWVKRQIPQSEIKLIDEQTIARGHPYEGSAIPRLHQILQTRILSERH